MGKNFIIRKNYKKFVMGANSRIIRKKGIQNLIWEEIFEFENNV